MEGQLYSKPVQLLNDSFNPDVEIERPWTNK